VESSLRVYWSEVRLALLAAVITPPRFQLVSRGFGGLIDRTAFRSEGVRRSYGRRSDCRFDGSWNFRRDDFGDVANEPL
jgi:hypothetical protein